MSEAGHDTSISYGWGEWKMFGPDGKLKGSGRVNNLVTRVGQQMYRERGAGVSGAPASPTGMKLGTGGTAPALTGAGAALVTYLSNSHQAFDSTYPQSSLLAAASLTGVTATAATDLFTSTSHGLTNGQPVKLTTPPAGLTAGVFYYVITATTNTFQLATSAGGSAVDVTADGSGITVTASEVRRITYQSTWGAGKATTASAITEVALVNDTLADATSTAANTAARNLLSGINSKGAADSLVYDWYQDVI